MYNIVLLEPEIPQNTGNIGRTCLLTGSRLHLIRPFKFSISNKALQRSGLDYWQHVDLVVHDSYDDFMEFAKGSRIFYIETDGNKYYHENKFEDGDYLVFGKETKGIDKSIIEKNIDKVLKVPMNKEIDRSLNLSNTVALVLYEALRQIDFPNME